jgi:hypothetical protein
MYVCMYCMYEDVDADADADADIKMQTPTS